MTTLNIPNTLTNGSTADASAVQQNFDTIETFVNTDLVNRDGSISMTGELLLPSAPTSTLAAATKGYVDTQVGSEESARITADSALDVRVGVLESGSSTAASDIAALQGTDIVVTLTGSVVGSGTITDLGDVTISTTVDNEIPIFADAAARDAAITAPVEGQFAFLSDHDWLTWYDGSAWVLNRPATTYSTAAVTLSLADAERTLTFDNASQVVVTVPTNASVNFPVGTRVVVHSIGAGGVTLSTTGLTIRGLKVTCQQFEAMYLEKFAADSWIVIGGTS